ncbi:MAG TPA: bifunctional riboflavin kinase/FAD synthetase [Thermoanaerobaculia bacterium]|nr:bifunctional riboflavin kinase/FAD synthetase [Thermoanaerobaculia bacterium]HUM28933.1 bifunctional riboflavin kinase/FAD synthetase [Thermoanaerobaculia bacterium]HXK67134.1 bifunctional riboflavin kinase/FAD synthetase [Thermoanaerobaculia bacterium]
MIHLDSLHDPAPLREGILTIGNYDGFHLGHRAILSRVLEEARLMNCPGIMMTFEPHPSRVLIPSKAPPLINTPQQKVEFAKDIGLQGLITLPFNRTLSIMEPEAFVSEILVHALAIRGLIVGQNFRFGHRKRGDLSLLASMGKSCGFFFEAIPPVVMENVPISSSRIRAALQEGRVEAAGKMLDRPFSMTGTVVRGVRRGRTMGIPTVNLEPENELWPGDGVYLSAVRVRGNGKFLPSVSNIGIRPTFEGSARLIETHILDYFGDLYGEYVELRFFKYLRGEKRFSDAEALKAQIHEDIVKARSYFEDFV